MITGGDPLQNGLSEAEVYKKELLALGMKDTDIETETQSRNTFENAKFTSAILKQHNYDQIVLVTSAFHLKRSLLYFNFFDISAVPVFSDYLSATLVLLPNSYYFLIADFAIHEYIGIIRFYFYNWMGWNVKSKVSHTKLD